MASATGAELLNAKWDQLGERFDRLKSIPEREMKLIRAALSDWQDWYWGNYESWDSVGLQEWQATYVKTAALVDAVAKKTVIVADVTQTDDYHAPTGPVVHLPPLLITARPPPPPPPYVPPPPVTYQEGPLASERSRYVPIDMSGAAVDVSDWERMNLPGYVSYARTGGTAWDAPALSVTKPGRGGLIALVVAIGAGIWAKRSGVL